MLVECRKHTPLARCSPHSTKPVFLVYIYTYIHSYLDIISIRRNIISIRLNNGGQDQIQSRISPQSRDLARTTFISGSYTQQQHTLSCRRASSRDPTPNKQVTCSFIYFVEREIERQRAGREPVVRVGSKRVLWCCVCCGASPEDCLSYRPGSHSNGTRKALSRATVLSPPPLPQAQTQPPRPLRAICSFTTTSTHQHPSAASTPTNTTTTPSATFHCYSI